MPRGNVPFFFISSCVSSSTSSSPPSSTRPFSPPADTTRERGQALFEAILNSLSGQATTPITDLTNEFGSKEMRELCRKEYPVVSLEDFAPVDDFHVGGRKATMSVLSKLNLGSSVLPETESRESVTEDEKGRIKNVSKKYLLDVGCGIGGTCRVAASAFGCHALGVDLDGTLVDCGNRITR